MKLFQNSVQIIMASFLLVATGAYADSWNCSRDDLVREVVVEYPEGGSLPCAVIYKKQTEGFGDQTLWSASNEAGYCEQKAKDFVAKIESWGGVCMETIGSQGGESM